MMGVKDLYLLAYNGACFVGWLSILVLAVQTVFKGLSGGATTSLSDSLARVYDTPHLALLLTCSQSAALLEILHAALGLVRSPVIVTAMQVSSRIFALVAVTFSAQAQSKSCVCFGGGSVCVCVCVWRSRRDDCTNDNCFKCPHLTSFVFLSTTNLQPNGVPVS